MAETIFSHVRRIYSLMYMAGFRFHFVKAEILDPCRADTRN